MASRGSDRHNFLEMSDLRGQYQALDQSAAPGEEDAEWPSVSVSPLGEQRTSLSTQKNRRFWSILAISIVGILLLGSVFLVAQKNDSVDIQSGSNESRRRDDDRSDSDSFLSGFPPCQTRCKNSCIETKVQRGEYLCCDWQETIYGSLTCSQTFDSRGSCYCTGQALTIALQKDLTTKPTHRPTIHPTHYPSSQPVPPSFKPTKASKEPTAEPTHKSKQPSAAPIEQPVTVPTAEPPVAQPEPAPVSPPVPEQPPVPDQGTEPTPANPDEPTSAAPEEPPVVPDQPPAPPAPEEPVSPPTPDEPAPAAPEQPITPPTPEEPTPAAPEEPVPSTPAEESPTSPTEDFDAPINW